MVFDDTVYFLPCKSAEEAAFLGRMLNSPQAKEFYGSMAFWADKRPITVDLLRRLSLAKLAVALSCATDYERFAPPSASAGKAQQRTRQTPKAPSEQPSLGFRMNVPGPMDGDSSN